ncbi:DUF7351 domain-containing protein [Haladaptatus caseinilyticus]|uniref:DUF7351 domain-containing protein n=1 Tax=Haladaptatus caseinilyticus TaxID=2993314 RepID=UPI00224A8482|nr:hypothetical protein [Haladaptatus caseinilyticus]
MDDSSVPSRTEAKRLGPATAFSLLGDPLRLDIIRVLFEAGRSNPVPFSELYEAVDVGDTGRFNYHRDNLVPHYIRKTDDGYLLTEVGKRVARAVNAGAYTESPELEEFDVRGECYACGIANLKGEYVGERFRIDCQGCGNRVLNVGVPPSIVRKRDPRKFVNAFEYWARAQVEQASNGLCPECGGSVDPGVSTATRDTFDTKYQAVFDCVVCDRRIVTSVGSLAFQHEAIEQFFRDRNDALTERPYWAVKQIMTDEYTQLCTDSLVRIRVTFRASGDTCHIEFDDNLTVVDLTVESNENRA